MKITTAIYNDLTNETCISMIERNGVLVDEVVIFGFIRIKIFSLHNFYVQAVYNNNDESLLEIKALISQDDWQPYMETLDLKDYFNV
tara:strand:+ start:249 stop:509 length:261 start_codon:yes stop_codon:yes gene_type:complete